MSLCKFSSFIMMYDHFEGCSRSELQEMFRTVNCYMNSILRDFRLLKV